MRSFATIAAVASALGLASACTDEPVTSTAPAAQLTGGSGELTGTVYGPDGTTSICDFLTPGGRVRLRTVNATDGTLVTQTDLTCPDADYGVVLETGSYLLRTTLLTAPTLATLPLAQLDLEPVVIEDAVVERDVHMREGQFLGGQATLDGEPIEGTSFNLYFEFGPRYLAGNAVSGPDGTWTDGYLQRDELPLQTGIRYTHGAVCPFLGTRPLVGFPGAFLFPDEVSGIDCTLETAPNAAFSHELTRMVVTPMPADIGGYEDPDRQHGRGWGVQFPVGPEGPSHVESATHLYAGGLMIGVEQDVVLAGINLGAYGLQCFGPCRDLGLDAELEFEDEGTEGRRVTWSYTAATSAERVRLRIIQRSYDGRAPADYVLVWFSLRNLGRSALTLYPGFFADWDVDEAYTDDVGNTAFDGRLMYMTSSDPGDAGTFVGTLMLGAPVAGTLFYAEPDRPQTLVAQMEALKGVSSRPSIEGPGDKRAIHSLGPVTLQHRQTADFWIAIVGGEEFAQLVANARAAAAHVGVELGPVDAPAAFSIDAK